MKKQRGFTMMEVLVVVAILALLITILLPALGSVTQMAHRYRSMSNLRQLQTGLQLYGLDYGFHYPSAASSDDPTQPLTYGQTEVPLGSSGEMYFRYQGEYWVSLVLPYFGSAGGLESEGVIHELDPTNRPMFSHRPGDVYSSKFVMSSTAFADPDFFTASGTHTSAMLRATRSTEVKYPARKGILNGDARYINDDIVQDSLVGFADGHTAVKPWVAHSFVPDDFVPFHLEYHISIMATKNGLEGIDF